MSFRHFKAQKMETIEKLKLQIENLLQKLNLQREENSELRNKLLKSESENKAKDEYIRALEQKIAISTELKNLDAKG
jgi:septal ring factor EnvC (AmiA/AmiB activator)